MDFVKKAMDKGSGSKDTSSSGSKGSGGDDYVDKGTYSPPPRPNACSDTFLLVSSG